MKEEVDVLCHGRELPQVSFLSRQNTSIVATKYACRDKIMFVATSILLSRQIFVATEICLRQVFVATNISRDKSMLVATEIFVATEICLSRQAYFCRDKHNFVATKHLSRQK